MLVLFSWTALPSRALPPLVPPSFTVQPVNATASLGGSATFAVAATGNPAPTFQWRYNGQSIPGAVSANYTVAPVQAASAGTYDVVASNVINGSVVSTTSDPALLAIGTPPRLITQPVNTTAIAGSTIVLEVEATGDGPLTYQWWSDNLPDPVLPGGPVFTGAKLTDSATVRGTTTPTLIIAANQRAAGIQGYYGCVVTDAHGSPVSSSTVALSINYEVPYAVTTLAGVGSNGGYPNENSGSTDGTGASARFSGPTGISLDSAGNLYVTDMGNNTIRKITAGGQVTTLAGSAGTTGAADGVGALARFHLPFGIVADSQGNLFVADSSNHTVRRIDPLGMVSTVAGLAGSAGSTDGTGGAARFNLPLGIAIDGAGNLYVADQGNHTVRRIDPSGQVTTFAGLAGSSGTADGMADAARFMQPTGLTVDSVGNLFITDPGAHTVRKITPSGLVSTFAGLAGSAGTTYSPIDGIGSAARFGDPEGIISDPAGNLYVTDRETYTIRKISPQAVVTTLAGQALFRDPAMNALNFRGGSADGSGGFAQFSFPVGITRDAAGNLYVADNQNETVRRLSPPAAPVSPGAQLVNGSVLGFAGAADQTLVMGFSVGGAGTKPMILRAVGPGLAPFGVVGAASDPMLALFDATGTLVGQNDDWDSSAALTATFAGVGAFTLAPGSKDAAFLANAASGTYTVQVPTRGASGLVLVEAYDASPSGSRTQLANFSARGEVNAASSSLSAGFAIGGSASRTVLIRGIGPTLRSFGLTAALAQPQLRLFSGSTSLAQDSVWNGDPIMANAAEQVGAFSLDPTSFDSGLLVTLPPGVYVAQLSGVTGAGIALFEIYPIP